MIFLVITITTGRCGVVRPLAAGVGEASAAGLGDSPRIAHGARKLNVPRIQAQARTSPRLARRFAGGRVSGISRPTPRVCSFSPEVVGLPPVVVTDFVVVLIGAGAGTTTVRAAGADAVVAEGGGVALRWITMVRCFTMGLGLGDATRPGAAATVDAEDVPIPQLKVTAAAPAMKEAASPPAVSTADRLFIARPFVDLRR